LNHKTNGELPSIGSKHLFSTFKTDLSIAALLDYAGSNVVLNIFPSVDTGTCAASVKILMQKQML
jgi:thiol peroxidase